MSSGNGKGQQQQQQQNRAQQEVKLSKEVLTAIQNAVASAVQSMEHKLDAAQNAWKSDATDLLNNVAKNKRYVEDFVERQGDYTKKLNIFTEDLRHEIDARLRKGTSPNSRLGRDILAQDELPPEYFWRLERLEKLVGTYKYLEQNKDAQAVDDRLTALENAVGVHHLAESYADGEYWSNFQSAPPSNLRMFSREQSRDRNRPGRPGPSWDNNALVPIHPRSSANGRSPRPHTLGNGEFQQTEQRASQRVSSTAPHQLHSSGNHPAAEHRTDGEQEPILDLNIPPNTAIGASSLFVAARLQDMNVLMKAERDAKFEMQTKLAELTFALDQQKFSDEELRKKINDLTEMTLEQRQKEHLLTEQRDKITQALAEAQRALKSALEDKDRETNEVIGSMLDQHPDVLSLKQKVEEMQKQLETTKEQNALYEKNMKDLVKFTKDVEEKRIAAIEEKKGMESLLLEAKKQLSSMNGKLEKTNAALEAETKNKKEPKRTKSKSPTRDASENNESAVRVQRIERAQTSPAPNMNAKKIQPSSAGGELRESPTADAAGNKRPSTSASSSGAGVRRNASDISQDVALLREELQKEEAFLNQVNTLRLKVKDDISAWLVDFKNENGRDPTVEDKEAIASKYKAFKEATNLKESATARIKSIKDRYQEIKKPAMATAEQKDTNSP